MKVLGFAWVSILNVQSWDLHLWMWICFFVNVALVLGRSLESLGNKSRNLLRCGCTLETFQSFSIRIFRDCEKFCYSWGHERASEESTFMRWLLSASAQCRGTKSQSSKNPKDQKDRFFWFFFCQKIGSFRFFQFLSSLSIAQSKYQNGEITVVEKFLSVTEEWTRTSEKVKNEAVTNFQDLQLALTRFAFACLSRIIDDSDCTRILLS